jgi:hypothetical protein
MKFIITEDERLRILNLYEQTQSYQPSQFVKDIAKILSIPETTLSVYDLSLETFGGDENKYMEAAKLIIPELANVTDSTKLSNIINRKILESGQIIVKQMTDNYGKIQNYAQNVLSQLNAYQGQMTPYQKRVLDNFKAIPQKLVSTQQPTTATTQSNTSQAAGEKINTTNDRSYDYKLSGGKYYYSAKGQNKWIEAKGKGLESIKSKVKF